MASGEKVWGPQKKNLKPYFKDLRKLYESQGPWPEYPGSQLAPQSPLETQGYAGYGGGMPQIQQAGAQYGTNVLQGQYLGQNPWLDATFNQGANQIQNRMGSQFGGSRRLGSGGHYQASADALGNFATQLYGGDYAAERDRMGKMAAYAPGIGAGQTNFYQGQLGAGAAQRGYGQAQIGEEMRHFNFPYQQPWDTLNRFGAAAGRPNSPVTLSQSPGGQGGGGQFGGMPLGQMYGQSTGGWGGGQGAGGGGNQQQLMQLAMLAMMA